MINLLYAMASLLSLAMGASECVESRNYFHHGELLLLLFLIVFGKVHSQSLIWCPVGNSCIGSILLYNPRFSVNS